MKSMNERCVLVLAYVKPQARTQRVYSRGVYLNTREGYEGYRIVQVPLQRVKFSNWCQIEAEVYVEDEPRRPTLDLGASTSEVTEVP